MSNDIKLLISERLQAVSKAYDTKFNILKNKVIELTSIVDDYDLETVQEEITEIRESNAEAKKIVKVYEDEVKLLKAILEENSKIILGLREEILALKLNIGEVQLLTIDDRKAALDKAIQEMQSKIEDNLIQKITDI